MRPSPSIALLAPALTAALLLSACGSGSVASADGTDGSGAAASDDGRLQVVAAFYPLEFLATGVAGERADVSGLTPAGAEPHDLELGPQALAGLTEADLLVVLGGFQPAVDDALATTGAPVLDLVELADRPYEEGGTDPHFWTDPTLMAEAAGLVADALSEADPDGAATYAANAEALVTGLEELDAEAREALASCEIETLVTAHDAFGYFGERYGFEVRPVNGISPDQEPDARTQAELADFVAESGITTVYTETLVSTAVADTVAAEAGVATAVLDPLEGLTDDSAGEDYREVMRANIDAVRTGQVCA